MNDLSTVSLAVKCLSVAIFVSPLLLAAMHILALYCSTQASKNWHNMLEPSCGPSCVPTERFMTIGLPA